MNKQCDECPWRKDVPIGVFPLERFVALRPSVEEGWGTLFACHKSPECDKRACVGYVMNQAELGPQNFNLRRLLSRKMIDPTQMTLTGPQYKNYAEMLLANRPRARRKKRA